MKLAVIGVGYVGLVTGVGFAEFGNDVICADTDKDKIDKLSRGELMIYEPGLDRILESNISAGRLSFTTNMDDAILSAEVIFICVGTPQADDGSADLSSVYNVASRIGETLRRTKQSGKVIIIKSTCPVGTTRSVSKIIASYKVPSCLPKCHHASSCSYPCVGDNYVAFNPEFLREGTAIEDFMRPDRVVIGTDCEIARSTLLRLYRPITSITKVLHMDSQSAELVKYASNAMLASRITFMNELSNLAVMLGANINRVREGIGSDARIGSKYLYPGPGYGGSCLPKDVSALLAMADSVGVNLRVVQAAYDGNKSQLSMLGRLVSSHFGGNLSGKTIAVWGLSFKAETDDIRESPALKFIDDMIDSGACVVAHDPKAMGRAAAYFGSKVRFVDDMYDAINDAHALAVCTEWREYRSPDVTEISHRSRSISVFDGRNIWDSSDFQSAKIPYTNICLPLSKGPRIHSRDNKLQPIGVLGTSSRVVATGGSDPLQNSTVHKTGT